MRPRAVGGGLGGDRAVAVPGVCARLVVYAGVWCAGALAWRAGRTPWRALYGGEGGFTKKATIQAALSKVHMMASDKDQLARNAKAKWTQNFSP